MYRIVEFKSYKFLCNKFVSNRLAVAAILGITLLGTNLTPKATAADIDVTPTLDSGSYGISSAYTLTETQVTSGPNIYKIGDKFYQLSIKPETTSLDRIDTDQNGNPILGHFIDQTTDILGGAIYNDQGSSIGNITGDFINNNNSAARAYGGAIYNNDGSTIGNIIGDFINNSATGTGSFIRTDGGAIFNLDATIGDIKGNFINNYTSATNTSGDSVGGAICNIIGTIGNITGDFFGNYAQGVGANGGAIYTDSDLNLLTDNEKHYISGNYISTDGGVTKNYEAIYVDDSNATLNIGAINGGVWEIDDYINGTSGYNLTFSGDDTGVIKYNNDILGNPDMSINNATFDQTDGTIRTYNLSTLTSDNGKIAIDFDGTNLTADKFVTTGSATGTTYLTTLNFINDIKNGKYQVLDIASGDVQLAFGDNIKVIENGDEIQVDENGNILVSPYVDSTVYFGDVYLGDAQALILATTKTANDSVEINDSSAIYTQILSYLNNKETTDERNFIFNTSDDEYTVIQPVGETTAGTLNINGVANSDNEKSTIDFNGTNGFNLTNETTLNINNVKLTGAQNNALSVNNANASLNLNNVELDSLTANSDGAAIIVTEGSATITNSKITNNGAVSATDERRGGAILTNSDLNINSDAGETLIKDNYTESAGTSDDNAIYLANDSTLTLNQVNDGKTYLYDNVKGSDNYNVDITGDGTGTLYLFNDLYGANVSAGNTNINTINNNIHTYNFQSFTLTDNINMYVDMDLANGTMDRITASNYGLHTGTLTVNGINLLSDSTAKNLSILFADEGLANNVRYGGSELPSGYQSIAYSPIYKYNVGYSIHDDRQGYFDISQVGGGGSAGFNPAIMASPVATQIGGFLTQSQTLQDGFFHMNRYMKYAKQERLAAKNINKYAMNSKYLPVQNSNLPEVSQGMWIKPYTIFEKVDLKNGYNVENVAYGTLYGGDTDMYELGRGWNGIISSFIGYNGNHINYEGISMNLEGGFLGATGTLYKDNFFTGITMSAGGSAGQAHTQYGTDNFSMITSGIANKTGYNIELNEGKFIIQPFLFTGYAFVNTFDYRNAADVKINSDALHAIQLIPGIMFIGNLRNGWQPYAGVDMVWNIIDKNKVTANDVQLPQISVKPFVQYGAGIQRTWGERFTAFFQTMVRNGGRNGVALQAGFRWTIGRDNNKSSSNETKTQKCYKGLVFKT